MAVPDGDSKVEPVNLARVALIKPHLLSLIHHRGYPTKPQEEAVQTKRGPHPSRAPAPFPGGNRGRARLGTMAMNVMIFCHPSPYWLILRTDATFMFAAAIARDQALVELVYFPWNIGFIARWFLEGLVAGEV